MPPPSPPAQGYTSCSVGRMSHQVRPLKVTGVGSSHSSEQGRPNVSDKFCTYVASTTAFARRPSDPGLRA